MHHGPAKDDATPGIRELGYQCVDRARKSQRLWSAIELTADTPHAHNHIDDDRAWDSMGDLSQTKTISSNLHAQVALHWPTG